MNSKRSSVPLLKRVLGMFGRARLSADDCAMIVAYETLGALLARRFEAHGGQDLAAAGAILIDPEARDVFAQLSAGSERARIEAAARLLRKALHHVTAEYLQPGEPGGRWRLKMDCTVVEQGRKSQASLTRNVDWSELPDIVRESYMREERETYVLTLVPLPDEAEDRP